MTDDRVINETLPSDLRRIIPLTSSFTVKQTLWVKDEIERMSRALAAADRFGSAVVWHNCATVKPDTNRNVLLDWPFFPNILVGFWNAGRWFSGTFLANPRRWAEVPAPPPWIETAEAEAVRPPPTEADAQAAETAVRAKYAHTDDAVWTPAQLASLRGIADVISQLAWGTASHDTAGKIVRDLAVMAEAT